MFSIACKRNKPRPAQVGAPLKFLEYAKDTVFITISVPKNTPNDTDKPRKPNFPQLETQEKNIFQKSFFSFKSLSAELPPLFGYIEKEYCL